MNIISMMSEVLGIANPVIRKAALPHFGVSSDQRAERVRVSALDQLNGALDGHVLRGSEHKMDMIGHKHEVVQSISPLAAIVIKSLEK